MAQQLSTMNKKLEKLKVSAIGAQSPPFHTCGICGGPHESNICSNQPRNDPYSNTYNQGWKNHPNFSWGGNQGNNSRPYQPPFQRQQ
ncbi:hypothetical protein PIB30_083336 [Stylosanthes scabra]|uniref:Uncharacterized protein n=1 Tax=Stylosanthes scabra TaxID=79078 RepID=A0ABU6UUL4_9FABA|nr:hypothetical protein [Stylosanthes scabra]